MALNIKDPETDRLARELAEATGETITQAVHRALRERLARLVGRRRRRPLEQDIARIQQRVSRLPVLDARSADEVLGYDERGLPG